VVNTLLDLGLFTLLEPVLGVVLAVSLNFAAYRFVVWRPVRSGLRP
jgi:putative flippase GtrA